MKNNSIRIELFITTYEKKQPIRTERVELYYTDTEETARDIIKNKDLHYVKNERNLSMFESIKATCYNADGVKVIFKDRRFDTCETWGNY
jgi:hypothetical protein